MIYDISTNLLGARQRAERDIQNAAICNPFRFQSPEWLEYEYVIDSKTALVQPKLVELAKIVIVSEN